jgi:hypothetical protein
MTATLTETKPEAVAEALADLDLRPEDDRKACYLIEQLTDPRRLTLSQSEDTSTAVNHAFAPLYAAANDLLRRYTR